jgi:hypothetical protein
MAENKKTPTWNAEQTVALVTAWDAVGRNNARIGEVADKMGRTAASCRMKLVREGLYQKAENLTKTGESVISREELADSIAAYLPATVSDDVSSLAKTNKRILKALKKLLDENAAFRKEAIEAFVNEGVETLKTESLETAD